MMPEAIALVDKIAGIGFTGLVVLIGIGSYFDIWMWTKQYNRREAEFAKREAELLARIAKEEAVSDEWKHMALSAAGIAETSVEVARRRG